MNDDPLGALITYIICIAIIITTVSVIDRMRQKETASNSAVSTTDAGVSTTDSSTESTTGNLRNDKNER